MWEEIYFRGRELLKTIKQQKHSSLLYAEIVVC